MKNNIRHTRNDTPKLSLYVGLLLACVAAPSFAHVKWFIDANTPAPVTFEPFSFADIEVQIWLLIGLVMISTATFLDTKLKKLPIAESSFRHDVMEIFRMFTGISLLLTAYEGNLIAPHLASYGWFGGILVFLQAMIGLMFIAHRFMHHAALMLIILLVGVLIQHGVTSVFEYCNMFGIALFFLFNNLPDQNLTAKLKPYSVDMLRIFTGFALISLGVTEKLTGAVLGEAFIAEHGWNFMPYLGVDIFTDRLFVLSAGAMEVIMGTIMVLGVVTRLNTFVIAGFMFASNIAFLVLGDNDAALMELVGHMPIIGSALVLLLLGYGQRLKLTNIKFGRSRAPLPSKA